MKNIKQLILLFVICFSMVSTRVVYAADEPIDTRMMELPKTTGEKSQLSDQAYNMEIRTNQLEGWPEGPKTYCESGIVMDADTGAVLYGKNIDGKAFPASITKVLTMLIALENASLDDKITVTQDSVNCVWYGYAHIGLRAGEEITLRDALHALMLASANEVAYAIGESVGENYEWFIQEMNRRAKELGAVNSNFLNTNGMDDNEHYTTARDMALVTRELWINHPEFEEISKTLQYTIPATNLTGESRTFQQRHYMFYEGNQYYDPSVVAGKTGYTEKALNTLITCANKDGKKLICVVMKTHGKNVFNDTKKLLNYGFDSFEKVSLAANENDEEIASIDEACQLLLPAGFDFSKLEKQIERTSTDTGNISYSYNGIPMGSIDNIQLKKNFKQTEVSTEKDKKESGMPLILKVIFIVLFALILIFFVWILIVLYIRKKRRKRSKKRRKKKR